MYPASTASDQTLASYHEVEDTNEETPLLKPISKTNSYSSLQEGSIRSVPEPAQPSTNKRSTRWIMTLVLVIVGTFTLADSIGGAAKLRIYESIVCYNYWEEHDPSKILLGRDVVGPGAIGGVEEEFCKVESIQAAVAKLNGWQVFIDGIPSLMMAVPIGVLADHFGRKPVLAVGMASFIFRQIWFQVVCWFWQTLPLKLAWISALHGLTSGGAMVITSVLLTSIADVTHAGDRANYFVALSSINIGCNFLGPPLGAALMTLNPWVPFFLSTGFFVLTSLVQSAVPETLGYNHESLEPTAIAATIPVDPPSAPSVVDDCVDGLWMLKVRRIGTHISFLAEDARIILLLLPFMVSMMVNAANELQPQYASKVLHKSITKVIFYISVGTGLNTIVLMAVVPAVSVLLTRKCGFSPRRKDLFIAQVSPWMRGSGFLLLGFARSVPAYIGSLAVGSFGYGETIMVRSFITTLVKPNEVAKLYTLIGVMDTLAQMGAAPILARLFEAGMHTGEWAIGLPMWAIGCAELVTALTLLCVRIKKGEDEALSADEEEVLVEEVERAALVEGFEGQH